ncbi:MAG: site-2 protease family protein, partial [Candidatus Parcubacteria bacterium]|nr:site-2 protease family protein [Candidatus Parcubacteria bacterium]
MTFIIFIVILGILVLVHELGHFLIAKKARVQVDEFGFGYPPRALKIGRKWGTLFSLNWIPFGGFVKILGENYEEDEMENPSPNPIPEEDGAEGGKITISQETYSVQSTSQG